MIIRIEEEEVIVAFGIICLLVSVCLFSFYFQACSGESGKHKQNDRESGSECKETN